MSPAVLEPVQWSIGIDAAWGGMGLCLATQHGPVEMCHVALSGRTYRYNALLEWADANVERLMLRAETRRGKNDPPCVLAIEEAPMVYSTKNRGGGKGNQAQVCYSLGTLAGSLAMYWIEARRRAELPPVAPWFVPVRNWRFWWRITGVGRPALKASAILCVQQQGWERHLAGLVHDQEDGGPMGDAAEGILLAVGAARHAEKAPAWGPTKNRAISGKG